MTGNSTHPTDGAGIRSFALPVGLELGHYRLLRKIGQGGFGITYLAENLQSHEQVVIKENLPTFYALREHNTLRVYPLDVANAKDDYTHTLSRFVDEARTLAHLHHPGIVRVLEAFEALGTAYYVMPYIPGKELHKAAPAVVDEAWLKPILCAVLEALKYLHSRNLLHRDLKPGNILLQEDGAPILIDFGTARALHTERSATMVGTPGYTPIEQITPHGNRGPWTDLYALGATCYRLITGELPPQSVERIDEEDPYRPLAKRAELLTRFSRPFLQAIDVALAVRAKQRWQSASEWLESLSSGSVNEAAQDGVTQSRPVSTTPTHLTVKEEDASTTPGKRRYLILALLSVVLAGGVYGIYSYTQSATEKRLREEFAKVEMNRLALEKAERKAKEEAEQLARAKAEQEAKEEAERIAREKVKKDAQDKLKSMDITDYDEAILKHCGNPETMQLLIAAGADVNHADKDGWTPLIKALVFSESECVKLLLAAPGIDVNKADGRGKTPLYEAANDENMEVFKQLLAFPGIEVNKADNAGKTILYYASEWGYTECVKTLLSAPGIDVNKADKDGKTPLHRAVVKGKMEIVELLLTAPGIEVNKADKDGNTPLHSAERLGHAEIAKLLKTKGGKK